MKVSLEELKEKNKPENKQNKKKKLNSTTIILLGFFIAILIGTALLMLPFATVSGETTSLVDALFTATTSICVTGLVVVTTFSHWTLFGQIVILILIQIGGLGVVTLTSMIILAIQKNVSLKNRMLIQDAFNLDSMQGLIKFVKSVIAGTFLVEGIGALLYMIRFVPVFGSKGIYISIFTAISAFCNAGIDVIGDNSLNNYVTDPLINFVTIALIVLGGIGFIVWFDFTNSTRECLKKRKFKGFYKRLNEHTKLVLAITAILVFGGAIITFIFEYSNKNTIGDMSLGDKMMSSLFQSVTLRTAGFTTIDQANFTDATYPMFILLMFIGGSPVGTAGGIKTVTFAIAFLNIITYVGDRDNTTVFKRTIAKPLISKAMAVIAVGIFGIIVFTTLLLATNDVSFQDALYEITSALATVGLSRNMTGSLNTAGRLIVTVAMYLGRVGPISMAMAFKSKELSQRGVTYADGHFIVG